MRTSARRLFTATTTAVGLLLVVAGPALAAPNPHPALPGGIEAKTNQILGIVMAAVIIACVAGVFFAAGKLALAMRHGAPFEAVGHLAAVGVACVLVGSGAAIVNYLV